MMDEKSWTTKHKPRSLDQMVFSDYSVKKSLVSWFNQRTKNLGPPLLVITGPCGVGKSLCIEVLINEYKAIATKTFASDERTNEPMNRLLDNLIFRPVFNLTSKSDFKLFVLDEVDNSNDGTLITWLTNAIEKYSQQCSFVVIANDPGSKHISNLTKKTAAGKRQTKIASKLIHIKMTTPSRDSMFEHLKKICKEEKAESISESELYTIVDSSNGDFRRAVNDLQWNSIIKTKSNTDIEVETAEKISFLKLMSNENIFGFIQQSRHYLYNLETTESKTQVASLLVEYDKYRLPLFTGCNYLSLMTRENVLASPFAPPSTSKTNQNKSRFNIRKSATDDEKSQKLFEYAEIQLCYDLANASCNYDVFETEIQRSHGANWDLQDYSLMEGFGRHMVLLSSGKKTPGRDPDITYPNTHYFSTSILPKEKVEDCLWRIEQDVPIPKEAWNCDHFSLLRSILAAQLSNIYEGKESQQKMERLQQLVKSIRLTPERFSHIDANRVLFTPFTMKGTNDEDVLVKPTVKLSMSSVALEKAFDAVLEDYKSNLGGTVNTKPKQSSLIELQEVEDSKPKTKRKQPAANKGVKSKAPPKTKVKQCLMDDEPFITSPSSRSSGGVTPNSCPSSSQSATEPIIVTDQPTKTSRFVGTKRKKTSPPKTEAPPKRQKTLTMPNTQSRISSFFVKSEKQTNNLPEIKDSTKPSLKTLMQRFDEIDKPVVHRK